jgi:Protein of unknown function (DUF3277)
MSAYSFQNIAGSIVGPGGILNIAQGAGSAEEGITIEPTEDKNKMDIGADGLGQHTLIANESAVVTLRYLKTSPINAALMIMYNLQTSSSKLWGINNITVRDTARNDFHELQQCAFKKKPTVVYAKEGPMLEWAFDCIVATSVLGTG